MLAVLVRDKFLGAVDQSCMAALTIEKVLNTQKAVVYIGAFAANERWGSHGTRSVVVFKPVLLWRPRLRSFLQ